MLQYKTIASDTLELLIKLQQLNTLKEARLVGGTGLALQYGHRISVDLDLFVYNLNTDILSILLELKSNGFKLDIRQQSSAILIAMIKGIKVDIVNYPYQWIDQKIIENNITVASDKEIAAMKISAITNRGSKKDFIDLYYLLKKYSLKEILQLYQQKYEDGSVFLALKSLTYFDDADLELTPKVFDTKFNWEAVKTDIINETKKLL